MLKEILIGLVAIIVIAMIFVVQIDFGLSEGTFRGKVIDAEYTGIFWKNYVFHVQRTYTDTFNFTICKDNPNAQQIFETVKKAQTDGKELLVSYKDRFWYFDWECNGGGTPVESVQVVG